MNCTVLGAGTLLLLFPKHYITVNWDILNMVEVLNWIFCLKVTVIMLDRAEFGLRWSSIVEGFLPTRLRRLVCIRLN